MLSRWPSTKHTATQHTTKQPIAPHLVHVALQVDGQHGDAQHRLVNLHIVAVAGRTTILLVS
jgi:hypothetical protein